MTVNLINEEPNFQQNTTQSEHDEHNSQGYDQPTFQTDWQLDPSRCALLVIDMQNDFVSPGGFHHRHGKLMGQAQALIPNIQTLLRDLPQPVKRIFVITAREPDGSDSYWRFHKILPERVRRNKESDSGDKNVIRGTWGAEIVDLFEVRPEDHIIVKRRHSAFYQTDLEACLRWWGISTLIITGVASEICVQSTLRDAFNRDFDIILVKDAVTSWNGEAHEATVKLVDEAFGVALTVNEVKSLVQ